MKQIITFSHFVWAQIKRNFLLMHSTQDEAPRHSMAAAVYFWSFASFGFEFFLQFVYFVVEGADEAFDDFDLLVFLLGHFVNGLLFLPFLQAELNVLFLQLLLLKVQFSVEQIHLLVKLQFALLLQGLQPFLQLFRLLLPQLLNLQCHSIFQLFEVIPFALHFILGHLNLLYQIPVFNAEPPNLLLALCVFLNLAKLHVLNDFLFCCQTILFFEKNIFQLFYSSLKLAVIFHFSSVPTFLLLLLFRFLLIFTDPFKQAIVGLALILECMFKRFDFAYDGLDLGPILLILELQLCLEHIPICQFVVIVF